MRASNFSLFWKIAKKFSRRDLQYYAFFKLALDPAFEAVYRKLKNSAFPLLDVGCGIGLLENYLGKRGCDFDIRALDIDERKISYGQEAMDTKNVLLETGSASNLPAFSGNVTMLDVIHYFDDAMQREILHAIADRVAPGGRALIRIGIKNSSWRYGITLMEEVFTRLTRWIRSGEINFPTIKEIKTPFEARGFEVQIKPLWGWTPFNSYLFDCYRPEDTEANPL